MSEVRVVIQARLNSSRLPGKCLLPIGGLPLAVLCALRAGNTGLPVVMATSSEPTDDPLANTIERHGLDVFRGPLHDVYSRFVGATKNLPDDAWIVRLTADNVFPDGAFIEELIATGIARNCEYIGTHSPLDGLPYGVSAEAFRLRALRAVSRDLNCLDREHVTPAIKREFGANLFKLTLRRSYNHLRATIDTFADYQRVFTLFNRQSQPESIPWRDLCEQLVNLPTSPTFRVPFALKGGSVLGKLTLGTAQLGLPNYGRTNQRGQPLVEEANQLIETAVHHGVTHFDCAQAYGASEERVGDALESAAIEAKVITKLSPLDGLLSNAADAEVRAHVEASVLRSAYALKKKKIDVLMLHRWSHYRSQAGRIWANLLELQNTGVVGELGASVYDPEEAREALGVPEIKHLQIPFNILDSRWQQDGFTSFRETRPDVTIYARSAFLQGVLLAPPDLWPVKALFRPDAAISTLDSLVTALGRRDRADLCLAFALGSREIDSIVMGVESLDQLKTNLGLFQLPPLTADEREHVQDEIGLLNIPTWLLNPSEWGSS